MSAVASPTRYADRPVTEEEAAQLKPRDVQTIVNRSLAVFEQLGRIEAAAIRAERCATACEASASDMRASAQRCETTTAACELILKRAFPSTAPPPMPPMRRRIESVVEIADEDNTAVKELKAQVAVIAARDAQEAADKAAAAAVTAADARRLRALATGLGLVVALAAVAGIVWAIFKFAVHHADDGPPTPPVVVSEAERSST